MAYHNPTSLPSLELAIELLMQTGNVHTLKNALVDQGLLDGFADYLINLFTDNMRFTDSAAAAHDLVELVQEFKGSREQQQAVMALLPGYYSHR